MSCLRLALIFLTALKFVRIFKTLFFRKKHGSIFSKRKKRKKTICPTVSKQTRIDLKMAGQAINTGALERFTQLEIAIWISIK